MDDINKFKTLEFSYWLGLVHSDGSLNKRLRKNGKLHWKLQFQIVSEVLVKEFQSGLKFLNRYPKYFKRKSANAFVCEISTNSMLDLLHSLNIFHKRKIFDPPVFICESKELFGAYLAGLIDGDGDVRIKRKKYPQCVIRITSGSEQPILSNLIRNFLHCSVLQTKERRFLIKGNKIIKHSWFRLEFLVSSKNYDFLLLYVLPHIKLDYKRNKALGYVKSKYAVGGI